MTTRAEAFEMAFQAAAAEHPHPNPRVGAVIAGPDGAVLGIGAHRGPGSPHAERLAIDAAGDIPDGAVMFVTLEPCNHTGRTPPCTEAVVDAGISKVVVAAIDPDERVAGSGVEALRAAGVAVEVAGPDSDLAHRAEELDPGYFHHRRTGRPQVVLKLAATLDGQTAGLDGSSRWITGPAMRRHVHELRSGADAVMVGAGTVIADDPRLDVRLEGYDGPQPRPVVVAGRRPLPTEARIWEREPIVLSPAPFDAPAGEVVVVASDATGVDLSAALTALADRGCLRILVEGGATLARALLVARLVDVGLLHLGAKLAGGRGLALFEGPFERLADAIEVEIDGVDVIGSDLEVRWSLSGGGNVSPD